MEINKETFFSDYKGVFVAVVAAVILGVIFLANTVLSNKAVSLKTGELSFKAGEPYEISWNAKNVDRVGIALFNGSKGQWIIQNYPAGSKKYVWNSDPYQAAGTEYRFAVFAYPWKKGNPIAYSAAPITIVGQKYASCDNYSVEFSWPHISNTFPGIHKAFVTAQAYSGNLGGIAGADANCAKEAQKAGYQGTFIAFLGVDSKSASERTQKEWIYVEAEPAGTLAEGKTCHRLLAASTQKLLDIMQMTKPLAQMGLSETMHKRLGDVWFGRRTQSTETKCLQITKRGLADSFSSNYNCQDWTIAKRQIYTGAVPAEADLPRCYSAEGKSIKANHYGAVASGVDDSGAFVLGGDTCDSNHRLLCVEQ